MSADDRLARAIGAALCQRHGGTSASVRVLGWGSLGWGSFRSTGPWRALAEVQRPDGYVALHTRETHLRKREALHALAALGGLLPEDYAVAEAVS